MKIHNIILWILSILLSSGCSDKTGYASTNSSDTQYISSKDSPINLSIDSTMHTKVAYDLYSSDSDDDDNSYYSFATSATGYYYILLDELSPEADLELYVYSNETYTTKVTEATTNETNGEFLYYLLEGDRTYYIKINNYTNSDDIYYDVIVKSPNNITGIDTEGNGTIAKPKTVTIGTSINDTIIGKNYGDRYNYYKFTTTDTKGFYDITITDIVGGANLYIYLYTDDKFASQEGKIEDTSALYQKLSIYLQANTTYYVQVYNSTGTAINSYDIVVDEH